MREFREEELRRAIQSMPEAPADRAFAARVLAVAAVTRQERPTPRALESAWGSLFAGVMGFSLGAAVLFALMTSLAWQVQAASSPNTLAVVALEPLGDSDGDLDTGGS